MAEINCENCKHANKSGNEEPCCRCYGDYSKFEAMTDDTNKPEPLLTKNEYLALELTKAYVGQDMKPITAAIIAEKYEYFLGRFNKETET